MMRQATRCLRRRPGGAAALAALTVCVLAGAARVLAPPRLDAVAEFPRVRPADLAHLLADVFTHTDIPSSWALEEEAGNYTSWRYVASYACGARCRARARVEAHEAHAHAPRHGRAGAAHRVRVRRTHCHSLPLLPWPELCAEIETQWIITGTEEDGAHLQETAWARCGALAALLARCPAPAALAAERDARLARLRGLLPARPARSRT